MRVTIKREDDIIQAPDNSATLEKITEDGFFLYKVKYAVDPSKAIKNNALTVRIHVASGPYEKKVVPMFSGRSSEVIIENVLLRSSRIKDLARSNDGYLLSITSDISSKIPNDRTQQLTAENKDISFGFDRIITPISINALDGNNINPPVLEMNTNTWSIIETPPATEQEVQNIANQLLYEQNIDPASFIGDKTNTLVSAKDAFSGISPETSFLQKSLTKNCPNVARLIESLLNSNNVPNKSRLNETEVINVIGRQGRSSIVIIEDIRIPMVSLSSGDFYCIFELVNDKGLVIQTVSSFVSHAKNLKLLRIPTESPSVKVQSINKPGKVVFSVTQKDKNGTGINIFRRKINPGIARTNAAYEFIGKVDIGPDQVARVTDNLASAHQALYRFVPYSNEDNQAAVFSSVVAKFSSSIKGMKGKSRPRFVVMSYDLKENSVEIRINKIPVGVVAVELLRRNLTANQKTFDVVKDTIHLANFTTNGSIVVEDNDARKYRMYEYQTKLIYKDGAVEFSTNNLIVDFTPTQTNVLSMNIINPVVFTNGNDIDATFSINYTVVKDNFDILRQAIKDQDLINEFQDEITNDRDKIKKLFAFGIHRTNMTTGEIENFGIINSLEFYDRSFGKIKNVKPLESGNDYKYTVTAYYRNPETMFENLTRTVENNGRTHELKPNKWLHPLTLGTAGSLVSINSTKQHHSKTDFTLGTVADIQNMNISLSGFLPTITEARASQVRKSAVLIQWKVDGNLEKIDHFIVVLESLGIRTIIGSAHNISSTNYFEFLDPLTNGERGALTYVIIPVYYDYSRGTETKTNRVVI